MIPTKVKQILKNDKAAYKKSIHKIAVLNSKIENIENCILSAKHDGDAIQIQKLKTKLLDLKYTLAELRKENKALEKQLKNTIKICETHVEKRVLPSMSASGMSRFDFLPNMRSRVTGRIAEYSLVILKTKKIL
jgi:hypothetical protein